MNGFLPKERQLTLSPLSSTTLLLWEGEQGEDTALRASQRLPRVIHGCPLEQSTGPRICAEREAEIPDTPWDKSGKELCPKQTQLMTF